MNAKSVPVQVWIAGGLIAAGAGLPLEEWRIFG
jgi:hypothetical protein